MEPKKTPLFCGELCESGYETDRELGLIYGPFSLNGKRVSVATFSIKTETCAYCQAKVKQPC